MYDRSDIAGQSAKFDVILPYSSFSAHGPVAGVPTRARDVRTGRSTISPFGQPVGSPRAVGREFANYRQDLIIGASLQVSAPLGQYDDSKLLNLGNNRWSFRPELGFSKAWGPWTVEIAPSVTFFTDNPDFFDGRTFVAGAGLPRAGTHHLQFRIRRVAFAGWYLVCRRAHHRQWRAGRQRAMNTRAGLTLAIPVNRQNSIKFTASTGISTRTGSEFSAVGIAWQFRW